MSTSAASTFGGAWRLTYRRLWSPKHWLVIIAWSALLGLLCHTAVHDGRIRPYFQWMVDTYVCLLVPIIAFISGAGAIRDDLGGGMVDYVFTRPVRRPVYLVCKYLSHLACAQLDFLIPLGVMLAVGASRHIPGLGGAIPILLLGQGTMIAAFSAFGFFCGIVTSRYVVIGLVYAGTVEVGLGNIPTALNRVSLTHLVRAMLNPLTGSLATDGLTPLATTLQLALWSLGFLAVAAVIFSRRELLEGPRET